MIPVVTTAVTKVVTTVNFKNALIVAIIGKTSVCGTAATKNTATMSFIAAKTNAFTSSGETATGTTTEGNEKDNYSDKLWFIRFFWQSGRLTAKRFSAKTSPCLTPRLNEKIPICNSADGCFFVQILFIFYAGSAGMYTKVPRPGNCQWPHMPWPGIRRTPVCIHRFRIWVQDC